jgi:cell wall-associated NlpC family hydrolase
MSEAAERAAVVMEAMSWIGTPYRAEADVKGRKGGVDCVMILRRVYGDVGVAVIEDPRPYPPDWHMHRSEERYLAGLMKHAVEVTEPGPGDVVIFKWGRCYAHGGILTEVLVNGDFRWIHASAKAKLVAPEQLSCSVHVKRPHRFYSPWVPAHG